MKILQKYLRELPTFKIIFFNFSKFCKFSRFLLIFTDFTKFRQILFFQFVKIENSWKCRKRFHENRHCNSVNLSIIEIEEIEEIRHSSEPRINFCSIATELNVLRSLLRHIVLKSYRRIGFLFLLIIIVLMVLHVSVKVKFTLKKKNISCQLWLWAFIYLSLGPLSKKNVEILKRLNALKKIYFSIEYWIQLRISFQIYVSAVMKWFY